MNSRKINIVTLGCSKNLVDSEHLAGQLLRDQSGQTWEIAYDSDSTDYRTVVINTCGFIGDAKEESVNTILRFAAAKEAGDIDQLFVTGCLSERYREELRQEVPEVDQYFGVHDFYEILSLLNARYSEAERTERLLSTPEHYAYLKISEGCNWGCGYCAIPLIRGRHVSVPMDELIEEAGKLARKGVRELIVIGQDTTYYGLDLYGERKLAELLRKLAEVEGIEWIRLHYAYPTQFPQDVIEAIRDEPKICNYLDIPLQHVSDRILKSMRRGLGKEETVRLVETLRREIPDIAIRTTLLVGYPGETEEDFAELAEFVRQARFDRLGVFPYSEEEGTYSATRLTDDVPQEVKEERADRLMRLQRDIAREKNERMTGRELRVIVDRREGDYWIGRSEYDSPEVDQEILISSAKPLLPGTFVTVRIESADDYDLHGKLIG